MGWRAIRACGGSRRKRVHWAADGGHRLIQGGDVGPFLLAGVRSFFEAQAAAIEGAPNRARREPLALLELQQFGVDQRNVHLCLDRLNDHRDARFDPRGVAVATARLVGNRTLLVLGAQPAHRGRYPDPIARRRGMA